MKILQKLSHYRISRYFKLLFVIVDVILLNLATVLSSLARFGSLNKLLTKEEQTISLLAIFVWIVLLFQNDSNRSIRVEPIESILWRTIKKISIHAALISVSVVYLKYADISRLRMVYFYLIFFGLLMITRYLSMKLLKYIRSKGYNFKTFIIVGANESGEKIRKVLAKDLTYGYKFLGFFDEKQSQTSVDSAMIKGSFENVKKFSIDNKIDEMYVALHIDNIEVINELIEICEQNMIRIKFIPDFQLYTKASKVEVSFYENTPVLMFRTEPMEYASNRVLKKIFDVCFSGLVILLIFPWLFPIIMIIIKLESPGPVFFKQERAGRDNHSFMCLKFRSMHVNVLADNKQAEKGDSRITKFGAFIRKTSIDELPQFFNVFWGDMSVVGPRPHMVNLAKEYSDLISNYLVRQYAKPGITGWAQVNGFRGETKVLSDMENRVEYDIWYIENWSFLLDIKIVIKTVINIIKGEENAY
ncbi:undecaprenyl-phosphate galactose phosphotransferase/putative colanic acid biosynthesis UDP-glucose lipid carrier transferase [Flavobacterium nitrogenifigens]|uniref:Undecaprenyl-phosphate galactose phosphotransferase/putative colanic acid biosynthesis UDP-glucose lipid carrier transferase n=2 Tax=Flavobacterium TaxID=237 RepID=A0A7W7IVL4_9FLAO|nr:MULTISPECIES: undecaprenyl-phosphate glucose phosphotransferase [Flavobacterium]MBB4801404.1 undecaprenyl-phosphate galactose phosphotransferase/putative colanic acid biosynthesis UDP-glucose lipid carrier transferase [Flavobacterium nitrogenifigens]MBB6386361.1 undecaprenyl-phosphate galactose phosphotransferase/putative colanic acid biosynthesis UDP-glucose lipid carrier transferase [Flavobacterium notoginsengisoli]